jgi:GNAT superfamily N-acetyltransferase
VTEEADSPTVVPIRPAGLDDVGVLARHRAEMFREMGSSNADLHEPLVSAAERYFARALPAGDYFGWVAISPSDPSVVVAGAGVQLRDLLPRPDPAGTSLLAGPQALVVNVYTEPDWRRRGIAKLLMQHVLGWARERRIGSIVLHASAEGRALYEKIGFVATNEMRYGA